MDKLTQIVRAEIARQYKSVRQFAFAVDVPLSTINSALHNGIGGSSYDTVVRICKALGIQAVSEEGTHYLTEDALRLVEQYSRLDNYGRHTISSVMQVEYDRCMDGSRAKAKRSAEAE
ncbi:MAG: transcriptional regulator [Oscillospiraceae bacterium]|nr:transcriptional regulator [Oscillospiraceae bacterium]